MIEVFKRFKCGVMTLFLSQVVSSPHALSLSIKGQSDSTVGARFGTVSYNKTDGEKTKNGAAPVIAYEYLRFLNVDKALEMSYVQVTDPATKRDAYHAAYAGVRYYWLGEGHPIHSVIDGIQMRYDRYWMPYVQTAVGFGRILFEPISDGAGEFAADTLALRFGSGLSWYFFEAWMVDFGVTYDQIQSRGGSGKSLQVNATQISVTLGSSYFF